MGSYLGKIWARFAQTGSDTGLAESDRVKAVRTQDAKGAATPSVTAELQDMATKLLQLSSRDEQVTLLAELKKKISPDTEEFLRLTYLREKQHVVLMNNILPKVDDIPKTKVVHDHSKDDLFFFVAPAYFDGGVQTPEMKAFIDSELRHHYEHESHHPEYELYHDCECTFQDIVEMAIDRLARNVQFGNGVVNLDVMEKFKPKFSRGDNEAKREQFWECVLKYKDLVQETFYETYPDAREWSK